MPAASLHLLGAAQPPWFYEAPELRGDILLTRALRHRNQGEREQALADFDAGRRAYAAAAAIGESIPVVHQAMGELEYAAMVLELYGQGDVRPHFDLGVLAVKRALTALPGHYASLVLLARLHRSMAEHVENQGGNAADLLAAAVAAAESAVAVAPSRPEARLELGRIYRQWGQARQNRNQDPREQLRSAIAISESIRPEDRSYAFHVALGLVFDIGAEYEGQSGGDPLPDRGRAIASYLTAIKVDEKLAEAWVNLGINYFMRASDPRAPDADGDLAQATRALDEARTRDPTSTVLYYYGAEAHGLRAKRQRARGGDAGPDLAAALDRDRKGIAINPRLPHLHNGAGAILLEQAREAWDRGGAPDPLLAEAQAAFAQAIAVAPQQGFGQHNVGEALAQRASYQRARGEDPGPTARELRCSSKGTHLCSREGTHLAITTFPRRRRCLSTRAGYRRDPYARRWRVVRASGREPRSCPSAPARIPLRDAHRPCADARYRVVMARVGDHATGGIPRAAASRRRRPSERGVGQA